MDLTDIEGLSKIHSEAILTKHNSIVDVLKQNNAKLTSEKGKVDKLLKDQNLKIQQDSDSLENENVSKANTIDDLKKLLNESNKNQKNLEERIVNGEKLRVEANNLRTIGAFVDEFINGNVVDDQLVRGAIKRDISSNLVVRDGSILEINSFDELTGRTGDQVLSDAKGNDAYSKHLVATRATGGGAPGGSGGSGNVAVKTMTRDDYENSPLETSAQFLRDGGNVV